MYPSLKGRPAYHPLLMTCERYRRELPSVAPLRDADTYGDGQGATEFAVVASDTGSADNPYVDRDVEPDTRYVYRIKPRNAARLSDQSNYFNANTPAAPAPPTEVEVDAVPIVVESTTDDYFVLYVRHQWDENTSVELPVLVKKGEAGTTTHPSQPGGGAS